MPLTAIYEPRAFWDVQRVSPTLIGRPATALFRREHFRNGTRNPVELRYLLIAPVGYTFNDYPGVNDPPEGVGDVDACAAMLERCKLSITSPSRYHFAWRPGLIACWPQEQAGDTSMRVDAVRAFAPGLTGVCRWDFDLDRQMLLPRGAALEFGLGKPVLQPNSLDANAPTPVDLPRVTVAFHEDFGRVGGSARTKEFDLSWWGNQAGDAPHPWPPADGLGFAANVLPATNSSLLYDPRMMLNSRDWRQQQQTDAGSTRVTGFSVGVDSIAWEDAVQADPPANGAGQPLAALALRTPTRAPRMTDGGSKMDWWREGAPLALVTPTMTPAKVYRLAEPIVLPPGDELELELEVPGATAGLPSDPVISPIYQVGVSLCGYAKIEG